MMAENLNKTEEGCIWHQSATKFIARLHKVYEKYNKPFQDSDVLDLTSFSLAENRGQIESDRFPAKVFGRQRYPVRRKKDLTSTLRQESDSGLGSSSHTVDADYSVLSEQDKTREFDDSDDLLPGELDSDEETFLNLTANARIPHVLDEDPEPSDGETIPSESDEEDDEIVNQDGTDVNDLHPSSIVLPDYQPDSLDQMSGYNYRRPEITQASDLESDYSDSETEEEEEEEEEESAQPETALATYGGTGTGYHYTSRTVSDDDVARGVEDDDLTVVEPGYCDTDEEHDYYVCDANSVPIPKDQLRGTPRKLRKSVPATNNSWNQCNYTDPGLSYKLDSGFTDTSSVLRSSVTNILEKYGCSGESDDEIDLLDTAEGTRAAKVRRSVSGIDIARQWVNAAIISNSEEVETLEQDIKRDSHSDSSDSMSTAFDADVVWERKGTKDYTKSVTRSRSTLKNSNFLRQNLFYRPAEAVLGQPARASSPCINTGSDSGNHSPARTETDCGASSIIPWQGNPQSKPGILQKNLSPMASSGQQIKGRMTDSRPPSQSKQCVTQTQKRSEPANKSDRNNNRAKGPTGKLPLHNRETIDKNRQVSGEAFSKQIPSRETGIKQMPDQRSTIVKPVNRGREAAGRKTPNKWEPASEQPTSSTDTPHKQSPDTDSRGTGMTPPQKMTVKPDPLSSPKCVLSPNILRGDCIKLFHSPDVLLRLHSGERQAVTPSGGRPSQSSIAKKIEALRRSVPAKPFTEGSRQDHFPGRCLSKDFNESILSDQKIKYTQLKPSPSTKTIQTTMAVKACILSNKSVTLSPSKTERRNISPKFQVEQGFGECKTSDPRFSPESSPVISKRTCNTGQSAEVPKKASLSQNAVSKGKSFVSECRPAHAKPCTSCPKDRRLRMSKENDSEKEKTSHVAPFLSDDNPGLQEDSHSKRKWKSRDRAPGRLCDKPQGISNIDRLELRDVCKGPKSCAVTAMAENVQDADVLRLEEDGSEVFRHETERSQVFRHETEGSEMSNHEAEGSENEQPVGNVYSYIEDTRLTEFMFRTPPKFGKGRTHRLTAAKVSRQQSTIVKSAEAALKGKSQPEHSRRAGSSYAQGINEIQSKQGQSKAMGKVREACRSTSTPSKGNCRLLDISSVSAINVEETQSLGCEPLYSSPKSCASSADETKLAHLQCSPKKSRLNSLKKSQKVSALSPLLKSVQHPKYAESMTPKAATEKRHVKPYRASQQVEQMSRKGVFSGSSNSNESSNKDILYRNLEMADYGTPQSSRVYDFPDEDSSGSTITNTPRRYKKVASPKSSFDELFKSISRSAPPGRRPKSRVSKDSGTPVHKILLQVQKGATCGAVSLTQQHMSLSSRKQLFVPRQSSPRKVTNTPKKLSHQEPAKTTQSRLFSSSTSAVASTSSSSRTSKRCHSDEEELPLATKKHKSVPIESSDTEVSAQEEFVSELDDDDADDEEDDQSVISFSSNASVCLGPDACTKPFCFSCCK